MNTKMRLYIVLKSSLLPSENCINCFVGIVVFFPNPARQQHHISMFFQTSNLIS